MEEVKLLVDYNEEEKAPKEIQKSFMVSPKTRGFTGAAFAIDTGSHVSVLGHDVLAKENLNIPFNRLDYEEGGSMAGERLKFATLEEVKLSFTLENKKFEGRIDLKIPRYKSNPGDPITSILGMNFLDKFNTKLICNFNDTPKARLKIPEKHFNRR